ncbi:MAG TPA: ACP phosphodiesterase, partial [Gemmataceae bacterium]
AHDRLRSYARLSGIADALARLSARIRARQPGRQVYLEGAIPDLREHHAALAAAFDVFFPELLRFARSDAAAPPRSRAPGIGWRKADEILPFGATPAPLRV